MTSFDPESAIVFGVTMNASLLPMPVANALTRLVQSLGQGSAPRFATDAEARWFAEELELILIRDEVLSEYVGHLDRLLGRRTPHGELLAEDELDRFTNAGLSWLAPDRLALIALDRGAIRALHGLVFDLWSDYWSERAEEAEKRTGGGDRLARRFSRIKARLRLEAEKQSPQAREPAPPFAPPVSPPPRLEVAIPFGDAPPPDITAIGTSPQSLPVPASQTVWFAHEPRELSVKLNWSPDPRDGSRWLEVKVPQLPVMKTATGTAWLAEAGLRVIVRGVAEKTALKFTLPAGALPRFFFAEYRSDTADVFYAIALDGSPIDADTFTRLRAVAAADVSASDPARSATLAGS